MHEPGVDSVLNLSLDAATLGPAAENLAHAE